MASNLAIWEELAKTDPKHTKPFTRAGGFKGTAIKPIYSMQKMTEQFGPCGQGWGMTEPVYQIISAPNGEILVYCTTSIWWTAGGGGTRNTVFGVGGDKAVVKYGDKVVADDEAFKKAYTDALTNAMQKIGMSADVFMGMFDDSKYVSDLRQEFREEEKPKASEKKATKPPLRPETPFDEPPDQEAGDTSDWPAYLEDFKQGFLATGSYLMAQEYWSSQSKTLKELKLARPQAYSALTAWAKSEGDKLPKEAS